MELGHSLPSRSSLGWYGCHPLKQYVKGKVQTPETTHTFVVLTSNWQHEACQRRSVVGGVVSQWHLRRLQCHPSRSTASCSVDHEGLSASTLKMSLVRCSFRTA